MDAGPVARSSPDNPVTNDRYPGTNGSTHGDRNDSSPAAAATGTASSSGPSVTNDATLTSPPAAW